MANYEFVISAKDKTAQAFTSINSRVGALSGNMAKVGGAVTAVTAAFAALTVRAGQNAQELETMSQLAGLSVEEFQSMSYAFNQFNVSQENFADISKDVQDKLGDFLATGAGPFKDFFEQVAPKVGLTAEALKNLSSTDVLIAVKKAMDDANVSAKEQVFYMEAIANDATKLMPALQDNGKELRKLARDYDSLNISLSETEVDKLTDFNKEVKTLQTITNSIGDKIALNLVEPLSHLNEFLQNGVIDEHFTRLNRAFTGFGVSAYNAAAGLSAMGDAVGVDLFGETDELEAKANKLLKTWDNLNNRLVEMDDPNFGETKDIFAGLKDPFDTEGAVTNIGVEPEMDVKLFLDSLDALDEMAANTFTLDGAMDEASANFWSNFEERGRTTYAALEEEGRTFWEAWIESTQTNLESMDEFTAAAMENFSLRMGTALEQAMFDSQSFGDGFRGMLEGLSRSTINYLGQMGAQWLALQAVQLMVGDTVFEANKENKTKQAKIAGLTAIQEAWASAPFPFNMPAVGMATLATGANIAGIEGIAHSGIDNIPREGTWLLDRGERVVDSRTNTDLKRYLNNQSSLTGNSAPMQQAITQMPEVTINITGADMSSDQIARAIEKAPKRIVRALNKYQSRPL
ncbi:hypothetical protein [Alteromonas antoniana]|uniref:hypothetical protein n=1 Tax=Alteromonas antoniana TaxID=2803813 RepID=UPI001C460046|nr:hypothetical protein [Alteromonas antoniana]